MIITIWYKGVIILFFLLLTATFDNINGDLFKDLYYNYSAQLYSIVFKMVKHKEDTEDILQETYKKVYKNIERFYSLDQESTVKLLTIYAKNTAIDLIRKKNNRVKTISLTYKYKEDEHSYEIFDKSYQPENILITNERTKELTSCIDNLRESHRHIILLKYKYMMTNKEISKVLCISETAVSSLLDRARDALRKLMEVETHE